MRTGCQRQRDHRSIAAIVSGVCFRILNSAGSKIICGSGMRCTLGIPAVSRVVESVIVLTRGKNTVARLLVRPIPVHRVLRGLDRMCGCCAHRDNKRQQSRGYGPHGSNVEVNIAAACSWP
jgi:hypothetical protein